jgi:membrane-bound lytic murein transglycosylase B
MAPTGGTAVASIGVQGAPKAPEPVVSAIASSPIVHVHPFISNQKAAAAMNRAELQTGVPMYFQDHIWKSESNRLDKPWGEGRAWKLARNLAAADSECVAVKMSSGTKDWDDPDAVRKKAFAWCQREWRALQAICAAKDLKGKPVCDPNTVRTSVTFAMGPMQIEPSNLMKRISGKWCLTAWAIDFDRDGKFDPFGLEDAIGSAALISRWMHGKGRSLRGLTGWMQVTHKYYGEKTDVRAKDLRRNYARFCGRGECPAAVSEKLARR